jgi:hypothetical protein
MKTAKLDLLIQRGSTYRKLFQLQQVGGIPVDLLGSDIRAKLRKTFESAVFIDLHAQITDPVNGKCLIELSAAETEEIQFATGVYDVEIIFPNTEVQQVLFGNVLVKKEATYG